jgi:hypothetical protein
MDALKRSIQASGDKKGKSLRTCDPGISGITVRHQAFFDNIGH